MNNVNSFSDEQLLMIVNKTILKDTGYSIDKFSGGYVSTTTAYNNRVTKFKVCLFFGYKKDKKTSISKIIEIDENMYFIWAKALLVKTMSMKINNVGFSINEINSLIKPLTKEEEKEIKKRSEQKDRTDTVRDTANNLPPTSTLIPTTSIPLVKDIKSFIDLKKLILLNRVDRNENHIQFKFKNKLVSISDKQVPYFQLTGSSPALSFKQADEFYKYLFQNLNETLEFMVGKIKC